MADPVSLSGTAVGVIALGITVCQGLYKYYAPLKARNGDIQAALDRLEGLGKTLEILKARLPEAQSVSQDIITDVESKILSCKESIEELDEYLKKCRMSHPPADWMDKVRAQRYKFMYPFRQGTLQDLGQRLCHLQGNLDTAIMLLPM